jgi:prevent-host-death family protein
MKTAPSVSVRELKNQTTAVLRRVESGERVTVTKRGKVIATIQPASGPAPREIDSIYRQLQRSIEARDPELKRMTESERRREFERISRKVARGIPYKDWREMDRIAKGDPFGLSR